MNQHLSLDSKWSGSLRYDYSSSSDSFEDEMPHVTRRVLSDSIEITCVEGITGPDILEVRRTARLTVWDYLRRWFLNCALCCPCLYKKFRRL